MANKNFSLKCCLLAFNIVALGPVQLPHRPFAMLEGKLIIIPALNIKTKRPQTSQAGLAFVLMSQCGNNNELALQHDGVCTM